jgi:hypothetical protein
MRLDLRSLLPVLAITPPVAAAIWWMNDPTWDFHLAAGAAAIGSFALTLLLLVGVLCNLQSWQHPPQRTPGAWAAILASVITVLSAGAYFATIAAPAPPASDQQEASYTRWLQDQPSK